MNLALTYASRTHHSRLARHINESIQRKASLDSDDDYDGYPEDGLLADVPVVDDHEYSYTKSRTEALHKQDRIGSGSSKTFSLPTAKKAEVPSKAKSKFDMYMQQIREGKFLSSGLRKRSVPTHQDTANASMLSEELFDSNGAEEGVCKPREVFSDSENEGSAANGQQEEEEGEGEEGEGEEEKEERDNSWTSMAPPMSALGTPSTKRPNPFKVSVFSWCITKLVLTGIVILNSAKHNVLIHFWPVARFLQSAIRNCYFVCDPWSDHNSCEQEDYGGAANEFP